MRKAILEIEGWFKANHPRYHANVFSGPSVGVNAQYVKEYLSKSFPSHANLIDSGLSVVLEMCPEEF